MRAFEILKELKYEFKSNKLGNNFDIIAHRGKIWAFDQINDEDNKQLIQSLIDNLDLNVDGANYSREINLYSLLDQIRDYRPDILLGGIINGKTLYIEPVFPGQNPYSSKLIKDIIKFFDLEGVETADPDEEGVDVFIDRNKMIGKVPNILYHGTNSKYIKNIMTKGIMPVSHGNWEHIKFPEIVFLTADSRYAAYHARKQTNEGPLGEIPIVIKTRIPDKNKIVLDFDVAIVLYGKDHPEVKRLGYSNNMTSNNFNRDDITKIIQKVNKKTDLNTQTGIFGYKGRIPSTMFQDIIYPPIDEWQNLLYDQWISTKDNKEALNNISNIINYGSVNHNKLDDEE